METNKFVSLDHIFTHFPEVSVQSSVSKNIQVFILDQPYFPLKTNFLSKLRVLIHITLPAVIFLAYFQRIFAHIVYFGLKFSLNGRPSKKLITETENGKCKD